MSAFKVTLHREGTQETVWPSCVLDVLPYPGLRLLHAHDEWEVIQVRLHVRSETSPAALHGDPHIVDVLVKKVEGMFR